MHKISKMSVIQFNSLSEEQKAILIQAPVYIAYLIGGADNNFDEKEVEIAKYTVNLRKNVGDPFLFDYYALAAENFNEQLDVLVAKYENLEAAARTSLLIEELQKVNDIFPQVDSLYAKTLLNSWKSFAREVAAASGGFLGMLSVSYEEEHFLDLGMINPID